jgi:hypothetical protein
MSNRIVCEICGSRSGEYAVCGPLGCASVWRHQLPLRQCYPSTELNLTTPSSERRFNVWNVFDPPALKFILWVLVNSFVDLIVGGMMNIKPKIRVSK